MLWTLRLWLSSLSLGRLQACPGASGRRWCWRKLDLRACSSLMDLTLGGWAKAGMLADKDAAPLLWPVAPSDSWVYRSEIENQVLHSTDWVGLDYLLLSSLSFFVYEFLFTLLMLVKPSILLDASNVGCHLYMHWVDEMRTVSEKSLKTDLYIEWLFF